ncbi:MAG: DNA repair protein RecO [Rickettsiales bacterium]|nr:DNA repair protein RecO [Rickettsiales bacterium]
MYKVEDEAFLLSKLKFQESSIIVTLLTKNNGIIKGIIRGAFSKKNINIFEIGNKFNFTASARSENNLLKINAEIIQNNFYEIMKDRNKLMMISIASELIYKIFPENCPLEFLFEAFESLIFDMQDLNINKIDLYKKYFLFELLIQKEMGYELDLSSCAVCSIEKELHFLSPKTGRAVCFEHGQDYQDKIFKIPKFLLDFSNSTDMDDILNCANISEHFLKKFYFNQFDKEISYLRSVLINNMN